MTNKSSKELQPFQFRRPIDTDGDPAKQFIGFESRDYCVAVKKDKVQVLIEWMEEEERIIAGLLNRAKPHKREARERQAVLDDVHRLWRKLTSCKPRARCGSHACMICRRRFRRAYTCDAIKIAGGRPMKFVTYCPIQSGLSRSAITDELLERLLGQLLQHLRRRLPKNAAAIGRLDVKFHHDGTLEPHFHLIVLGCSARFLRRDAKPESNALLRRRLCLPPLPPKRGKGAPWVVHDVYPADAWSVVTYTARQMPKHGEVGYMTRREFSRMRHQRRMEHYWLDVQRLLFLDSLTDSQATVCFRVERGNGVYFRANFEQPSEAQLRRERMADLRDKIDGLRLHIKRREWASRKASSEGSSGMAS